MKRVILLLCACLLSPCLGFSEEEKLTITTYYPSPYGVYKNLRIYPGEEPDPASPDNVPGAIYFNEAESELYLYRNDTVKWQPVGSGGGGAAAVLVRSCPWGSDGDAGNDAGWGNQCGPYPDFAGCCRPPDCPDGWTEAGTEIKLTSLACPGNDAQGGGGCEWHGSVERYLHPVAVGHVLRTCVKKGTSVFTLSSPWRSDHQTAGANSGWGDQCVGPVFADCNGAPPACPAGYTSIGTNVEVHSVSCPGAPHTTSADEGCTWSGTFMVDHPVAAGSIVRICEEN